MNKMFNLTKKINARNSILALGVAAVGLLMAPNSAQAVSFVNRTDLENNDKAFNALIDNGQFSELFVAEGRIGDRGKAATYELSINDDIQKKQGLPVTEEQFDWENGETYDFTLEYNGSTVNYMLGNQTLSTNEFSGPINSIFLRTSAGKKTSTSLTNLMFNGTAIDDLISSDTHYRDIDYLQLNNISSSSFTITGTASMSWQETEETINTKNSLNAFQIKVGNSTPASVPEPGTIGAIFITGMSGLGLSKKKKKEEEI